MALKKKVPSKKRELTRKELRKQKRQLKKVARSKFYEAKVKRSQIKDVMVEEVDKECSSSPPPLAKKRSKKSKSQPQKTPDGNLPQVNKSLNESIVKLQSQMKNQRKRQLIDANVEEDKEIKFLEKRLKLASKKKISSSKAFTESGLDYILDVLDPDKNQSAIKSEVNFEDSDSDFYDDITMVQSNPDPNLKSKKRDGRKDKDLDKAQKLDNKTNLEIDRAQDSDIDYEDGSGEESFTREFSDEGEVNSESDKSDSGGSVAMLVNEDSDDDSRNKESDERGKSFSNVREDIYGRLRDETGNIIKENDGKYIPPHLRNSEGSGDDKNRRELLRQLKGMLNRLALNNLHSISNQVEGLFSKNSRYSMNEALFELYIQALVTPVLSPEKLIVDHALLIAALHANIGSEIGATLLQKFVQKFDILYLESPPVENKELDNILLLISYLYDFKLFEAVLMYDILNRLCGELSEKNVELILIVLKSVGFTLRKDDPLSMKSFLLNVQKQMSLSNVEEHSRMKYMLEVLLSIKNNNISKISDFNPEQLQHFRKALKSVLRDGNSIVSLRIGLDDLVKADERGRWWLVGSAWNNEDSEGIKSVKDILPREQFSAHLIALAKKHRMNTDNRRNIFCILMSAEDYQDAFEKILRLGLKGQQEREISFVILHCLLQEKKYNPYYAYVAQQMCVSNRRHKMTLQCALWDKFRALDQLHPVQINILAKFLAQIFLSGSLPITVLKVLDFTEVNKRHIRLLRQTVLTLAIEESRDSINQVFTKVTQIKKLTLFRESLRLFVHHFILKNMSDCKLKDNISFIYSLLIGDIL